MTSTDHCQNCGKAFDLASCVTDPDHQPSPGDVSICWGCGTMTRYDEHRRRRPLTPEEDKYFARDPMIHEIRQLMAESPTPASAIALFQKAHR